ncbi:hypothetical protein LTS18_005311, partial [Coniosporium uncinatum]
RRSRDAKAASASVVVPASKQKEPEPKREDETADTADTTVPVATTASGDETSESESDEEHDAAQAEAVQEQHDKEDMAHAQLARETSGEGAPLKLERKTTSEMMQHRDVVAIEDSESDDLSDSSDEPSDEPPPTAPAVVAPGATGASATKTADPEPIKTTTPASPTSPTSSKESKGLRSLLGKFRRRSKATNKPSDLDRPEQGSFSGGHSLTGQTSNSVSGASDPRTTESKVSEPASSSARSNDPVSSLSNDSKATTGTVELAELPRPSGTPWADQPVVLDVVEPTRGRTGGIERPVSNLTDDEDADEFEDAEEGMSDTSTKGAGLRLEPPKRDFERPASSTGSPVRETRFQEAL